MIDVDFILKENIRRLQELHSPYDPVLGIGSPIERFKIKIYNNGKDVWLPVSMRNNPIIQNLKGTFEDTYGNPDKEGFNVLAQLNNDRMNHDFEFWAITCERIKPKLEADNPDGQGLIPFRLNRAQRKLLASLEKMRLANVPIRIIITKARQWGGSTEIQIYAKWIQVRHKKNWNSVIVGALEKQAKGVRAMYEKAINAYPQFIQPLSFKNFQGDQNWKQIPERNCTISIASMESPDKVRQEDLSIAHLTEVGLWKKTDGKEPKDIVQSILGTIPAIPYTMIALESTAKGVGNYFHQSWLAAKEGRSAFEPFFLPWFDIEMYQTPIEPDEVIAFIESLNEYEWSLWEQGATLEGIKWYRWKLREFDGDKWRMQSEFPSNDREAFQSTGQRVFAPHYVSRARKSIRPPSFIGEIFPNGVRGSDALKLIDFQEMTNGNLNIWLKPNDPEPPTGFRVSNRYALFVDIGGRTKTADYSVGAVFDRYWMMEGGEPVRAATWHGHLDQDLLAWKMVQLAKWYEDALLAVEINSLRKDTNTEGDHAFTVLDEISEFYRNMFTRTSPDQVVEGMSNKWGFHTNHKSKGLIIDNYNGLLRDNAYVEYDGAALDEADTYEVKPDGSLGAVSGSHDDRLITTAGGLWLCTQHMPPPKLVPIKATVKKRTNTGHAPVF